MLVPDSFSSPLEARLRVPHRRAAFSLVEVVLALGITATALLVIFSLMPVGLASLQDTQRQIVETEIYNKISSELSTTALYADPAVDPTRTSNQPYQLSGYCTNTSRFPAYFDIEGNELTGNASALARAVFTVRCIEGAPNPNSWAPGTATGELLFGTVKIGFHQDPTNAAAPAGSVRQRTFLLSNHGS